MTPSPVTTPNPSSADSAWRELHQQACEPYRAAGRFAWHFARGKLGRDPVFRHLVSTGLIRGRRVVDIGCGQGLFASLLHQIGVMQSQGRWPAGWPMQPPALAYTGIELMPRDVARAEHAVGRLPLSPRFVCGDMREAPLPACDLVVILDVLHYVDHAAQRALLERVQAALAPGGRLLLRVGDMDSAAGFRASQWVDRIVTGIRGHRAPPTWGRPLVEWQSLLEAIGFAVQARPMSQGTPFANVLLIADRA
jgi:SAM-dependent methyltransferase